MLVSLLRLSSLHIFKTFCVSLFLCLLMCISYVHSFFCVFTCAYLTLSLAFSVLWCLFCFVVLFCFYLLFVLLLCFDVDVLCMYVNVCMRHTPSSLSIPPHHTQTQCSVPVIVCVLVLSCTHPLFIYLSHSLLYYIIQHTHSHTQHMHTHPCTRVCAMFWWVCV
jgi:hypothetical protein